MSRSHTLKCEFDGIDYVRVAHGKGSIALHMFVGPQEVHVGSVHLSYDDIHKLSQIIAQALDPS